MRLAVLIFAAVFGVRAWCGVQFVESSNLCAYSHLSSPSAATNLTFSAWVYRIPGSGPHDWVVSYRADRTSSLDHAVGIVFYSSYVTAYSWTGTEQFASWPLSNISTNSWTHLVATFTSTSRTLYVNGSAVATNSSASWTWSSSGNPSVAFGGTPNYLLSSVYSPANNKMAEVAVWESVLDAGTIRGLANGYSPANVRPLPFFYDPVSATNTPPLIGPSKVWMNGLPIRSDHPKSYKP